MANGDLLRTGGRVHKNKTGFDLIGLFVGSEGMLGIVTEITLKLLPLPPARATLSASFDTMSEAAAMVQEIFAAGFLPSSLEIADKFTLEAARHDSAGAHVPPATRTCSLNSTGRKRASPPKWRRFAIWFWAETRQRSRLPLTKPTAEKLWALRRQFSNSLRATGLTKLNEDIVVPRSRLVDLVAFAEKLSARSGFPIACFGHAGDGNIHVNIMADRYNREAAVRDKVQETLDQLFAAGPGMGRSNHWGTRSRTGKETLVAGSQWRSRKPIASSAQAHIGSEQHPEPRQISGVDRSIFRAMTKERRARGS